MGKSEQIRWTGVGANQILIFPIYESMDERISSRPLAFFCQNDEMSGSSIRMLEKKRRLINYP
ncbi:hypothetical protein NIES3804_20950 [Microcystis aeruginosa NIES-3804]|uniref:Uncharacterized protein n=1 Tax=Microcystis aeruginosa NIES-3804 TaxID=2517783 RepID=A0A6H9GIG3_MICAE|nr:hypothetical protein NIES3804_20950 [Microcystis aeruginosa NIES-3804]